MTTAEIARLLRVSRQTVTRWIRAGKIAAITIRVGAHPTYRVRRSAFRDFVRRYVEGE